MSQNLQNFVKFQKFQLENLVDFEKCCKNLMRIFLQKSVPIQPKTNNILPKSPPGPWRPRGLPLPLPRVLPRRRGRHGGRRGSGRDAAAPQLQHRRALPSKLAPRVPHLNLVGRFLTFWTISKFLGFGVFFGRFFEFLDFTEASFLGGIFSDTAL